MKKTLSLLGALLAMCGAAFAQQSSEKNTPVNPFDTDFSQWGTRGDVKMKTNEKGEKILEVFVPTDAQNTTALASVKVDIPQFEGRHIAICADIKADNVTKPGHDYNGIKIMLTYEKDGKTHFQNRGNVYGSFDWQPSNYFVMLPEGATKVKFVLGLQDCTGRVEFKNPSIRPVVTYDPNLPPDFKCAYTDRVKNMPAMRGFMSPNYYRKNDLDTMKAWGANLVRWQICRNWSAADTERDIPEYESWIDKKMAELDIVLEHAQKLGIKVIIDMHTPAGGRYKNKEFAMFHEEVYFKKFVEIWKKIALKFKDHPALWAFDIINEPAQKSSAEFDYLRIQYETAKAIRDIDPEVPIIIESNDWDSARAFLYLSPLNLKNLIYQVHMYVPTSYTHQGVREKDPEKILANRISYPGKIDGKMADGEYLEKVFQPVIDFQKKYGARIYLGEFSAIRWAPGAEQYLQDVIAIAEKHGWDWTYHAFGEWQGWNLELGEDPRDLKPPQQMPIRQKVIRDALKLNSQN